MPKGVYKRTDYHKEIISNSCKGRISPWKGKNLSEKHKKSLSKATKRNPTKYWLGKKGYWDSKKLSEEHRQKLSENHADVSGKNNPMHGKNGKLSPTWQNGISFEPYTPEFNGQLKRLIRQRDNRQCQLCGIPENGNAHDIHHINYIKKDSSKRNLITLCHSHNAMANMNREKWQFLFETLQEIRRF